MIVSASYKTDIPAFYGAWFEARLAAGRVSIVSPWGGKTEAVDLTPDAVDGFVFWTRNAAPFAGVLARVAETWPFTVQYTITGYPRPLERSVPATKTAIEIFKSLARAFGPRAAVWRYDPILITSLTPPDWHVENFGKLARRLAGATDEVTVSFAHMYRKTERNLTRAAAMHGFEWHDPPDDEKKDLLGRLAETAVANGLCLTLCAQPHLLVPGVRGAACIDPGRLFGRSHEQSYRKSKNRPGCLCAAAKDIGQYETCPQACVYCYAVNSADKAVVNASNHDPLSDLLVAAN